jgi:hypothetical protein
MINEVLFRFGVVVLGLVPVGLTVLAVLSHWLSRHTWPLLGRRRGH